VKAAHERKRQIAEAVLTDVAPEDGVFEFVRRCIAVPVAGGPPSRRHLGGRAERDSADGAASRGDPPRSQRAGSVRPDLAVADIVVVLMAVRSIADVCDSKSSTPSLRFLELLLDGLRPGHQAPAHER